MKNNIQAILRHVIILCAASIFTGNNFAIAQGCRNAKQDFTGEDQIDLADFFKTETEAGTLYRQFRDNFVYTSAWHEIDLTPATLNMRAIADLHDTAAKYASGTGLVTGLRIILGMDGNRMVYFYQPVFMNFNSSEGKYQVNGSLGSTYYKYNTANQRFDVVANASDVTDRCAEYYNNIYIDHFENDDFVPFREVEDNKYWKGDTKSIIFSFQEIYTLYDTHYPNEQNGDRYCRNIIITNGAAYYRRYATNRYRLKHTLYIKTNVSGNVLDAANLAHLCPPSCNLLNYEKL